MFHSDSNLMPRSTPDTTDMMATREMPRISSIFMPMPISMPVRVLIPVASCSTPRPNEVAIPKAVTTTIRMSKMAPSQPFIRASPNSGVRVERIDSGLPLRKEK
ncbi:hypothetical protein D3C85_1198010 [compost metagenome]